jgi:glycosyltransferase involved in cell wall biosynthesis
MRLTIDLRVLGKAARSGIEEYTHELAGALLPLLTARGHSVNFFYNGLRQKPLPENLKNSSAKIINWGIPNKLLDIANRTGIISRLPQTDLIWSPHFNSIPGRKIPRVITFHDLSFVHFPQFFSWKQHLWHKFQNWRSQARQAARIIAVSEFTKKDLVETAGIPADKISVVYSGINPDLAPLPKDDSRLNAWSVERRLHEKPFILYLGTLEPRKNITGLIRAFNILKSRPHFGDFELVLAGGLGWLYKGIMQEIAMSPWANSIRVLGTVSPQERVFLYNKCRCFVYPSFFEGFGFPPLEAQASGAPVVAANRASLMEILGDSALLADPWKIGDLADSIAECLENKGLRAQLIAKGRANAARFSWKEAAAKTLDILEHV